MFRRKEEFSEKQDKYTIKKILGLSSQPCAIPLTV
jgi:hypothetical protein